jgi:hypothetical protein
VTLQEVVAKLWPMVAERDENERAHIDEADEPDAR